MSEKDKVKPNSTSYMIYIQACIKLKAFDKGKAIHEELKEKSAAYTKNKVNFLLDNTARWQFVST